MEVIYTEVALEDLRHIPRRFAAQIVTKISRLEHGLRGKFYAELQLLTHEAAKRPE